STALYYFLSWSKPLEMLRSYVIESMWAGGTIVLRGIPPGRALGDFVTKDLTLLAYGKHAANISIDPRLYDVYEVKHVPTIVFTTVRQNMQCQGVNPVSFQFEGKNLAFDTCPPLDPASYRKLSGAVTTNYAL